MLRNPRWPLWLAIVTTLLMGACGPTGPTGPNRDPVASFTTSYSGTEVTFDAGNSSDPDGDTLAYAWDFGDGTVASGAVAVHRYTVPGTFVAQLTVSDGRGGVDATTATLPVGEVAGDLEIVGGAPLGGPLRASAGSALAPRAAAELPPTPRFVPGEVIVRFAEGVRTAAAEPRVAGVPLERVRDLALPGAVLYRAPAGVLAAKIGVSDDEATWALVRALQARPDVVEALPNYLVQPHAVPTDPEYTRQWHLRAIGLEQAWDVTTGDASIVVAVLDTGILYSATDASLRHPDLVGRVVPGYDFVSLETFSGDGDGRDPDPYDPNPDAAYHGTHVAGTIGAATHNGVGIAGVDWAARLLPVRVMGAGGGPLSDVMDGMLWAAGYPVDGVPANGNWARVVNLSLGASVPCSLTFQDVIDLVVDRDVTIVVAAGNERASVDTSFPANCRDVIAVGATDRTAERAWYSNHGPRIAVMAPGGDMRTTAANGVYSLGRDPGGAFGYTYAEGTSMAAAHVSGVVALMLSLDGDLTPVEVRALLRLTANSLTATECTAGLGTSLSGSACGAGLIDAAAAVASLGPTPPPPPPPPPAVGELTFEPGVLDFGSVVSAQERTLRLTNVGDATVDWEIVDFVEAADNPVLLQDAPNAYTIEVSSWVGQLTPGASETVRVTIMPGAAAVAGVYRLELVVEQDGVERRVPVRFEMPAEPGDDFVAPRERTYVGTFRVTADGEITVFGLTEYAYVPDDYLVLTMGGEVRVLAWVDVNASGLPDGGDYVGEYPTPVSVAGGQLRSGIDITAEPFLGTSAAVGRALAAIAEAAASTP
ncbi:MAG: S8 family serine peptidase [Trueperaceae bacterium]|nr:S8 family serine peptidase [Trueperaceae bacterium]